jgi:hypothetical protein
MLGNSCFIPLNGAAAIRTMTTALQHLSVCLQFQLIHYYGLNNAKNIENIRKSTAAHMSI